MALYACVSQRLQRQQGPLHTTWCRDRLVVSSRLGQWQDIEPAVVLVNDVTSWEAEVDERWKSGRRFE